MRTECISAANLATPNHSTKMNFNGLWGKEYFTNTETLYGGEFECDYYVKPYYPCSDETPQEIEKQLMLKQKELEPSNKAGAAGYHGSYTSARKADETLPIKKADLSNLIDDCKKLLKEELPTGILKKLLKIK